MITMIPAKLKNWVIIPLQKIINKPKNVYITLEYENQENIYKDTWYYKVIEANLNNIWSNDDVEYSLNDLQDVQ